jgi:hypothetical protein
MKTQANIQSQPSKKLTLNKETVRQLTNNQATAGTPAAGYILGPTADCSVSC